MVDRVIRHTIATAIAASDDSILQLQSYSLFVLLIPGCIINRKQATTLVAGGILVYGAMPEYEIADDDVHAAAIIICAVARHRVVFEQEAPSFSINRATKKISLVANEAAAPDCHIAAGNANRATVFVRMVLSIMRVNARPVAPFRYALAKSSLVDKKRIDHHFVRP